jgi:HD-like signal output (HDOD) protein
MEITSPNPTNLELEKLVLKIDDLAVLPHVVFKVLELTASTDSQTSEMERAIIVDPGFSSKLLVLANSAYYGLPKKVTSIREALVFLGYRQVRNLAMTIGMFDMFVGKTDKESLRRRSWWRHSVDSAVSAKWIAYQSRKVNPDDAYTCGLLHYIGRTLLDRVGGRDYEYVERLSHTGMCEFEAESKVYGCNHVELAIAAAGKWGLPEAIGGGLDYIGMHPSSRENPLAGCTAVGSRVAWISRERGQSDSMHSLPSWALAAIGIDEEKTNTLIDGGSGAIASAQLQFA